MASRAHHITLELSFGNGELRASLVHAGPALAAVQSWASRAVDLTAVRGLFDGISALLDRANRWGELDQGSRDLLRTRGMLLFDSVLPGPTKQVLRDLAGGTLTLVLDEALVFVPWELMHTGTGFLGLDWAVGRVVRTPRAVVGAARPAPEGPWRVLVLCDPRGDLIGSYYEGISLRDELDVERIRLTVDLRSSEVGVGDVKSLIREYDIIHYAGHAEAHPDRPSDSGWLLSDGVLSAEALFDLAGGPSFPRIVFSNACRSARVDGSLAASERGEVIFSLANAFLLSGVRHYVGALWDVPDEPACHLAIAFYDHLASGAAIGEAMRLARLDLVERYGPDTILWGSHVLYGDPAAICFEPDVPARAVPRPPAPLARPGAPVAHRPARPSVATRTRGRALAAAALPFSANDVAPKGRRWFAATWLWAVLLLFPAGLLGLDQGGATSAPRVLDGAYVASTAVERLPVPRPPSGSPGDLGRLSPGALAAPAEVDASEHRGPQLELVVQGDEPSDDAPREPRVMHSWDHFQLRIRLEAPAAIAVWHVSSQGEVSRLHPAEGDLEHIDHLGWFALPDRERWFYLDDRPGLERFILGVAPHGDEASERELDARLAELSQSLTATRERAAAERANTGDDLLLRGVGGSRALPRATPSGGDAGLVAAIDAALDAHYHAVRVIEVVHR